MTSPSSIVVLTGAGISAESGLATFRDAGGLWEKYAIEDVATPEAFFKNPGLVYDFYNQRRAQLRDVEPNAAHVALAEFEERFKGDFLLVTQNVDDLHQRAGSKNILAMHGELKKARCAQCQRVLALDQSFDEKTRCSDIPSAEEGACSGSLRPHIVWFGEIPLYLDKIYQALERCDLFIVLGTSCSVHPAAGFVAHVSPECRKVYLNLDAGENDSFFDICRYGKASDVVKTFFFEEIVIP